MSDLTPRPYGCGHNAVPDPDCHTMWFAACPHHFGQLKASLARTALSPEDPEPFTQALRHVTEDRVLTPSYFTAMAMIGEYAPPLQPGRAALRVWDDTTGSGNPHPPYVEQVMSLMNAACRAAAAGDPDNLDAVLQTISRMEDPMLVVSFLMSMEASAGLHTAVNDDCTADDVTAFVVLGSQVGSGTGSVVLRILVEMIRLHRNARDGDDLSREFAQLFRRITHLSKTAEPISAAIDIVVRALAQTMDNEVVILDQSRMRAINVDAATPENIDPEGMSVVWAVRAARSYSRAANPREASAAITALSRQHPDIYQFAPDVIAAGTQLLAVALEKVPDEPAPK